MTSRHDLSKNAGKFLFALFVVFLAFTVEPHPAELHGNWTINREVGFTSFTSLGEETPVHLTGSQLKITHRNIHFQDRSCNYRVVERGSQTPEEFFRLYKIDPHVSLPVDAEVLLLECEDDLRLGHLLSAPENLWFMWYGVLLEAAKS